VTSPEEYSTWPGDAEGNPKCHSYHASPRYSYRLALIVLEQPPYTTVLQNMICSFHEHQLYGAQQERLAAYLDSLAQAAGHADREERLKAYCTGLLLSGERKSVEPMAARLAPDNVRRTHQSLHHVVADAPWSDENVLRQVRKYAVAAMTEKEPVAAGVVDDTGVVKKGTHSVGAARQYCGQVGKQENCQVAVSSSVTTVTASLPVAWRLYLPESWAQEPERRETAGVPEEISFATKPATALEQIRRAVAAGVPTAQVLGGTGYGNDTGADVRHTNSSEPHNSRFKSCATAALIKIPSQRSVSIMGWSVEGTG
jgi:SRSO17 transposase